MEDSFSFSLVLICEFKFDTIVIQSEEQKISKKEPQIFISYSKFSYVQQIKKGCEKTGLLVKIIGRNVFENRQEKLDYSIRQRIIQMQSEL